MVKLPKVLVIMSTYNGEKYVSTQIDSILNQKYVDVTLHIFDDISTDNTLNIIKSYEEKNSNIVVHINETNKNFTYNFIDALFSFKDESKYDFYAFADQDDYWCDTKLISAINKIKEVGENVLYCANLKIVNVNLQYQNINMMPLKYENRHYDVLCRNIATGCTIVIDNGFKNIATKYYPQNIYLHDYWLALIANYVKDCHFVYDTNPSYILYRQHGSNLIGSNKGVVGRIKRFFAKRPESKTTHHLVQTFYNCFKEDIIKEDLILFEKIKEINKFQNRCYLARKVKSNFSLKFKLKIIFNKY